jgi:hypothetical protein
MPNLVLNDKNYKSLFLLNLFFYNFILLTDYQVN